MQGRSNRVALGCLSSNPGFAIRIEMAAGSKGDCDTPPGCTAKRMGLGLPARYAGPRGVLCGNVLVLARATGTTLIMGKGRLDLHPGA